MLDARDDLDGFCSDVDASDAPHPAAWTPDHVGQRLVEAMRTLDRLPRPKGPRAPGNHWPQHRLEWADKLAQAELPDAEKRERTASRLTELIRRPSGAEIDRMDRALDWLRDLREEAPDLALVATLWAWRLARRRSIRALCRERGWTPQTFHNRRARALAAIVAVLARRGEAVV